MSFMTHWRKIANFNDDITKKFEEITTIAERRYAEDNESTSDLAQLLHKGY